jgi:hypothetical protein
VSDPEIPELPPRPEPPEPGECCRGNCSPCVFEIYERQLERWEREVEAIKARGADRRG